MMSWLGDTPTSWPINSELADVAGIPAPRDQPLFRFLRYDIRLEQDWLARELGVSIEQRTLERYQLIDAPENMSWVRGRPSGRSHVTTWWPARRA